MVKSAHQRLSISKDKMPWQSCKNKHQPDEVIEADVLVAPFRETFEHSQSKIKKQAMLFSSQSTPAMSSVAWIIDIYFFLRYSSKNRSRLTPAAFNIPCNVPRLRPFPP